MDPVGKGKGKGKEREFLEVDGSKHSALLISEEARKASTKPDMSMTSLPRSPILSQVRNFLPKMEEAHKQLQKVYQFLFCFI